MKRTLGISAFFGLLAILISGCNSGNPVIEKITFPTVDFTISAATDTTIFGQQGTRIFIEKQTFQFADGTPVTDSIKIELKEFYKKSDILLADLSTESDGKLLETAGMLNITATSKGRNIEIKSDKRIVVHFPKPQDSDKKMSLFFADKSASDTVVRNWDIDTLSLFKTSIRLASWGYDWISHTDSTEFEFMPKNYDGTRYNSSPVEIYINAFNFSKATIDESGLTVFNLEFIIDKNGKIKNPVIKSRVSDGTKKELQAFIKYLPEFKPGRDNKGNIVERTVTLDLYGRLLIPLYKSDDAYVRSFDKKYSRFEKQPITNMNEAELEYYIFSVSKLGWINCDRFLETGETTDFFVKTQETDVTIKMVFKDIDGVLIADFKEGKYIFTKVPIGRQVTIFAIKNTNGQFQTAFQEITISDKPLESLPFKETILAELKEQLEKLN